MVLGQNKTTRSWYVIWNNFNVSFMLREGFRRDLLLLLGVGLDEIDQLSLASFYRRRRAPGYLPRKYSTAIARILVLGDIEKVMTKGRACYHLTSQGSKRIKENIPLLKLAEKPWDRKWRIVIFDIPEKQRTLRDGLRNKLKELGFGQWQKSVYITPHDIAGEMNRFFSIHNLTSYSVCLVAGRKDLGDDKRLARKVWNLDQLEDLYDDFIFECEEFFKLIPKERGKKFGELWQEYKELILNDPHLPKELLPAGWLGYKAVRLFRQVQNKTTRS